MIADCGMRISDWKKQREAKIRIANFELWIEEKKMKTVWIGSLSGINLKSAFTLGAMLLALSFPVQAQQPKTVPRIGYLSNTDPATESARTEGIRMALREHGHIEGQNIATEYRYAEGKNARLPELATELVRLKVGLILVQGDIPIRAAINATKTIPIVMVGEGTDPVEAGHVESLARPGGNITGITNIGGELGGKRLEMR